MAERPRSSSDEVEHDPTAFVGPAWKVGVLTMLRGARRLTARWRRLPDFLMIGGQRCGTTSFYNLIAAHPGVLRAFRKEVHFFDSAYARGPAWYRSNFALDRQSGEDSRRRVTGEATPYYIFHPRVPERAAGLVPRARVIALLRDPVARAYSHHQHEVRLGFENLGFAEALAAERGRLAGEEARLLAEEGYRSFRHQHFSYFSRGLYADQLERWLGFFPRDQLLVLRSEDYYADPAEAASCALRFLDLPGELAPGPRKRRQALYERLDPGLRRELAQRYAEPNRRLYNLLGRDLGWESG